MTAPWERIPEDYPRTARERVAWALCSQAPHEGFLNDDEFRALDALLRAVDATYGSDRAVDQFMARAGKNEAGFPVANHGSLGFLRRLVMTERSIRDPQDQAGMALAHAHLRLAFWRDFLGWADAAIAAAMEIPEVARAVMHPGDIGEPS